MTILAISYWLLANSLHAQVSSDSLSAVYSKKMQQYLDKDGKVSEVFSFTKDGIEIYQPATDTSERKFEGIIFWKQMDTLKRIFQFADSREIVELCNSDNKKSFFQTITQLITVSKKALPKLYKKKFPEDLSGLSIAIDPGHIGGDIETAKMEKKCVEMKPNSAKGIIAPIQLIEGNLTFETAKILKKKLEREGARVVITRFKPGISAFGVTFQKWKDSLFVKALDMAYKRGDVTFEEKNFLLTKANDTEIFRMFFVKEETRFRARLINTLHVDLTLVIHYNVDEKNTNWNKPSKKDFNMAFVGGSFGADELDKPEARLDFLRLLLTDDIEHSINFSKYIVESLVEKTKVPAAVDSNSVYLKDNCMKTNETGVYCRNLTLTRKVHGVICYGESLYQDNINECKLLSQKDSKRVEEVAEAYFEGIMNYVKSRK